MRCKVVTGGGMEDVAPKTAVVRNHARPLILARIAMNTAKKILPLKSSRFSQKRTTFRELAAKNTVILR